MPFLRRRRDRDTVDPNERSPESGVRFGDLAILDQLEQHGADLSERRHVVYYSYAPSEEAARAIAEEAGRGGFTAEVREPLPDFPGQWSVICETHAVTSLEFVRESDRAGGIEGGISTGSLLVAQVAMKPLATLNRPVLKTVDVETKEETVSFKERTDVTAVPAMGVVAETMMALVLADEATRKFGGDSLAELLRNRDAFLANLT